MKPGDRVVTAAGHGVVTHTRRDPDNITVTPVVHGRLWVWVKLDKPPHETKLCWGAEVRPER